MILSGAVMAQVIDSGPRASGDDPETFLCLRKRSQWTPRERG